MASEEQPTLCSRCKTISLDDLFQEVTGSELVEPNPSLVLDRTPEWASSACSLCNFFLDMVPHEERDTCQTISIYRAWLSSRNGSTDHMPLNAQYIAPRTALLVQTHRDRPTVSELPFVNYSKAPDTPVLINHEKVRYGTLRKWYNLIQKIPREEIDVLPVSVIDCHKREIVPVCGPCDYVALSYVWGQTAAQEAPKGDSLPRHLPCIVEDAMTVVRELGLQYLWVDRYCLDQSNKAEFQAQLNQMADIYRHALITIIGAAGSDGDYGLPGVSSRPRIKQPHVKIGDYTLWSSMTDPRKLVLESAWMTRAWTYQEGVFSWNWIAFTDEQVFFQRSNIERTNMERWWKTSCELFPNGGLGADANCPLLNMYDKVWQNEGAIHQLLAQYTTRKLTYQSDALNGILGLLKRCGNGPYRMNHYFGIPILGPLVIHRKAMGRDPMRSWPLTEAFLVNLCWKARGTGPRRVEFPSWSWAGWQAVYEGSAQPLAHIGLTGRSLTKVKLSVKVKDALVDWEAMCNMISWDLYGDLKSLPRELYIQAPTVPLTVCRGVKGTGDNLASHAAHLAPMSWCAVLNDNECEILIEVNLVDEEVASTLQVKDSLLLKGIILRQLDPHAAQEYSFYDNNVWAFALVVLEGQSGATRVGSLELRPDNYLVRWRYNVDHSSAKNEKCWVHGLIKEYVDCGECRSKALKRLVSGQKDELIKLS
ncbi:heterokaryon incompatibility protein-domain-containing protein [Aspergillus novoparasiticus]|uniref:Heterokaryon incompatibility protein-domain-containing protein n=1 Tax=Aspergillus novoparasiticus TaxID=986946 RepID=A0A5N6EHP6_9EURO|nr:heterokaryon incompatibility protein-domain-containing protein [Aspergillus novoparasiticus]